MGKQFTEDGLPILTKPTHTVEKTEDGLPILKKKEPTDLESSDGTSPSTSTNLGNSSFAGRGTQPKTEQVEEVAVAEETPKKIELGFGDFKQKTNVSDNTSVVNPLIPEQTKQVTLSEDVRPNIGLTKAPDPKFQGEIKNSIAQGTLGTFADMFRGIAASTSKVNENPENPLELVANLAANYYLYKVDDKFTKEIETDYPVSEESKKSFMGQVLQGAGSMLPYIVGGAAVSATKLGSIAIPALIGSTSNGGAEYKNAYQMTQDSKTMDDVTFWETYGSGRDYTEVVAQRQWLSQQDPERVAFNAMPGAMAIGTLEGLPIGSFFKRMDGATGGLFQKALSGKMSSVGGQMTMGMIEEATQEAASQALTNINAKLIYDQTRDIYENVAESGGIGGLLGGTLNGLGAALKLKRQDPSNTVQDNVVIDKSLEYVEQQQEKLKGVEPNELIKPYDDIPVVQELKKEKLELESDLANGSLTPEIQAEVKAKVDAIDGQIEQVKAEDIAIKSAEIQKEGEIEAAKVDIVNTEASVGVLEEQLNQSVSPATKEIIQGKLYEQLAKLESLKEIVSEPLTTNTNEEQQKNAETPQEGLLGTEELAGVENAPVEENSQEVVSLPKDEIPEPISQGIDGEENEGNSRNEEIASELRGRIEKAYKETGGNEEARKTDRELENKVTHDFAEETGAWIGDFNSLGKPFAGGNENTSVLDVEANKIYKSNNLLNSQQSFDKFFDKIRLHNKIFPETAYRFEGFAGLKGSDKRAPYVEPVYSQDFIKDSTDATTDEISDYMSGLGFEKLSDTKFTNGEVEVSDLFPRNVLKDANGDIYVVDAEIKELPKESIEIKNPPTDNEGEVKPEPKEGKKKSLLNRAFEGDTTDDLKAAVEKHGLTYEVETHVEAERKAKEFIEDVGVENALNAVRKNLIEDGAAAYVWSNIIDSVGAELATATNEAEIAELEKLEADLISEFDRKARSGGRFISSLADIYQNSDFGYKASTQIEKYKSVNGGEISPEVEKKFKDLEADLKEVQKKLIEAEERAIVAEQEAAIKGIEEDIARKAKEKKDIKEVTKRIANKIRQGKVNRPSMFLSSSPAAIAWDGAVEIAATAIEVGGSVAQAIKSGVDHIRNTDWFKGLSGGDQGRAMSEFYDFINAKAKVDSGATMVGDKLKIPNKLIRSKVEQGITNPDELVKAIKDDLKEEFPDISDRDIRQAISNYGRQSNPSQDQIKNDIAKIKRINTILLKLEDIAKNQKPSNSSKRKQKLDDDEKALKKELKAALKSIPEDLDVQAERLATAKLRIREQIEKLQERLDTKDFAKKTKPLPPSDSEVLHLKAEKRAIQNEFDKEQYANELKNRTKTQKVVDGLFEVWGITRALRATGEFSFMLIQGGVYAIAHPKISFNAFKNAISHFASEKRADAWVNHLQVQEFYPRMKASKLALTEHDAKMSAREEQFLGGWVNHIWDAIGYPLKAIGKNVYESWKKVNPTKAFERAGVGYLNTLRVAQYVRGEEMLNLEGKGFEAHPQSYKDMADVINTFTGRASIGFLEGKGGKVLSAVFFSPRNWASIVKQTTPYAFYWLGKKHSKGDKWFKPSVAQKMALGDYMRYVALTGGIIALIKAMEDDDDKEGWKVSTDPHSSDFLKPRKGDTRIDPWGGRIQMIVLQARLLDDVITRKGKQDKLGSTPFTPTRFDLLLQMAQNKLAPSTAMLYKFAASKVNKDGERFDKFGNKLEFLDQATDNLYPIFWETLQELHKEQPATVAGFIDFMAFMGLGTQTYSDNKVKKRGNSFPLDNRPLNNP